MLNDKLADKNTGGKYVAKSELDRLSSVFGKLSKDAQATKDLPVNDSIDDSPVLHNVFVGGRVTFALQ